MDIYRTFTRQTDYVVQYLSVARQYEHHTRVEVPKLKHAPVNLGRQLEEYLKDPDFEIHRRQYLAEQDAKKLKGGSSASKAAKVEFAKPSSSTNSSQPPPPPAKPVTTASKGPEADLIDFFESIEQNQTPMAVQPQQQPQPQPQPQPQTQMQMGMSPWGPAPFQPQQLPQVQTGFVSQPTGFPTPVVQQQTQSPFSPTQQIPQQVQPAFTGAGFGPFSPQPQPQPQLTFQPSSLSSIPQDSVATFQTTTAAPAFQGLQAPQQTTNPFRQSMLMNQQTGTPFAPAPAPAPANIQQRPATSQSTNPFARSSPQAAQPFGTPVSSSPFQAQPVPPQAVSIPAPMQPLPTGTNPFAKHIGSAQPALPTQPQRPVTAGGILSQPTGSTNPFRQGAFVNHNTGLGWQHNQQPIGGGLDQLDTIQVFPRPAQQTPWQQ
jgi:hypothetical protein